MNVRDAALWSEAEPLSQRGGDRSALVSRDRDDRGPELLPVVVRGDLDDPRAELGLRSFVTERETMTLRSVFS
jgi:hypothetical protein